MYEHHSWYNGSVWHRDWPHQVYVGQWPIFYGPVILLLIWKTIWWRNIVFGIMDQCDTKIDLVKYMWVSDLYFMVHWFCRISCHTLELFLYFKNWPRPGVFMPLRARSSLRWKYMAEETLRGTDGRWSVSGLNSRHIKAASVYNSKVHCKKKKKKKKKMWSVHTRSFIFFFKSKYIYSTWYIIWSLVSLLGECDSGVWFPAFLDCDGENFITDTRGMTIFIHHLNNKMQNSENLRYNIWLKQIKWPHQPTMSLVSICAMLKWWT